MQFDFDTLKFEHTDIHSDKIVISASDRDVSWKELQEKVERICLLFSELKIPKGHPIIIYGHKEHLFPVAILACIKMHMPYVPVDMVMPAERLKQIKTITGSEVLICCNDILPDLEFNIVINNSIVVSVNKGQLLPQIIWNPKDPIVYIMFTSGSTGEPKGVMISSTAIKSFISWLDRDFGFSSETVFMNQASFSFDISLIDTYYTFSKGSTVVLNSVETVKNADVFLSRIEKNKCSVWISTPSFIYMYLSEPSFNSQRLLHLNTFLLLGEVIPSRTLRLLHEKFPECRVLNSYGPTEATVATTLVNLDKEILEKYSSIIPIGYPKSDGKILIENSNNNPEEEGEIIIVGDHVSIGYMKNESLTREKFFKYDGMRAYRTGDYGYYKDGLVFFNGRKDDQVKLNGFRIELGEINTKLTSIDIVDDAATIPLKNQGQVKKIISFVKLRQTNKWQEIDAKNYILNHLKSQLPLYMVPGDIRFIESFPTNVNHKVDKLKLLEIYTSS